MEIIIAGILLWILAILYTILGHIVNNENLIPKAQAIAFAGIITIIIGLISLFN